MAPLNRHCKGPFPSLAAAFVEGCSPQVITVIGSGGKTSLIWLLAQYGRGKKTLVTTTTRMFFPPKEAGLYDYLLDASGLATDSFQPQMGISLAGVQEGVSGKYRSLPPALLASLVPSFDLVLIEGDGSRMLPLKAWAPYEPVIPASTTLTIGILPLWPVGLPVSPDIIHRLPLFSALSGAQSGEPLSLQHLVPVITGQRENRPWGKGLFSEARGKRILFFNQIEDPRGLEQAEQLLSLLPAAFLGELKGIIAGSVQQNRISLLWET
ncbi:MAG: putative selenium-dependent hydroxylase accessory protein YqeC [Treponema sp.]|jgi:probable selenium-dependent hydroxylase accessory protein YqeC|nr:putative selenium-dependent hydroxylase accessory protein YqeC [Treponema sp.]